MRWLRGLQNAARSALTRQAGKLGAAAAVGLMLGFAQAVFVARWLGPRDFGIAALVVSLPALVFTFFDPQADEAVVRYLGRFSAANARRKALAVPKLAYALDAALAIPGFAIIAVTATWAADHLLHSGPTAHLLVIAGAAQMVAAPAETSRAVLTSFGRFTAVAVVQSAVSVLRCVVVLSVVAGGGGLDGFVLATCGVATLESVALAVYAHRTVIAELGEAWWHGRRSDVADDLAAMRRFVFYTDLTSLIAVFIKQADIVILGWIRGPTEAGYYRLARSLASPLTSLTVSLQTALYPEVAKLAGAQAWSTLMGRVRRLFLIAGLPLACSSLLVLPVVPHLIDVAAGEAFAGAVGASRWLLAGSALVLACFWLRPLQLATGQVRFMFINSSVLGVLSITAFVVVANGKGSSGVAAVRTLIAGFIGTGAGLLRLAHLERSGRLGDAGDVAERPG